MLETHDPPPLPAVVEQWKEAGSALANSFSNYLDLCLSFSQLSEVGADKNDLVSHFDSALQPGALLTVLSDQLAKSRVVLAKGRNRLATQIYTFPTEILSRIFLYFVEDDSDCPTYVEFTIRTYYHRLHTLLGVSSVWRKVGISMPILWNLVPVIRDVRFTLSPLGISLSLRRSKTLPLDLAVLIPQIVPHGLATKLAKHASRFRTINILSEQPHTIREIMSALMERHVCDSLTELSLCVSDLEHIDRLGNNPYYMFPPQSPAHPLFIQLLQSITQLRLLGATLDWSQITFSARMVEIRIRSVIIGSDSVLHEFLQALATAPQLEKLELATITSFPEPNLGNPPLVILPKLQSLILSHLYFNTLSVILCSITPFSHRLSLNLNDSALERVFSARDPELEREYVGIFELTDLLRDVHIDTLLIEGQEERFSLSTLSLLFKEIPTLNTLKLDGWTIDNRFCSTLKWRPQRDGRRSVMPKIPNWCLTNAKVADQKRLKELIRSHDSKEVLLGGYISDALKGLDETADWKLLEGKEDIVEWLAEHVPTFRLVPGDDYLPPEFLSAIWQLW
ncbi:unnamed protein product [Rhizoctonia solani]|uniref:F-box domain-containing protein n=1 Tax=Rhizoctonia solani TaxID=456999 RepID=A0A8H3E9G7_9AGAM|nr:unnamed protein product [Rhizoctonia solani]